MKSSFGQTNCKSSSMQVKIGLLTLCNIGNRTVRVLLMEEVVALKELQFINAGIAERSRK